MTVTKGRPRTGESAWPRFPANSHAARVLRAGAEKRGVALGDVARKLGVQPRTVKAFLASTEPRPDLVRKFVTALALPNEVGRALLEELPDRELSKWKERFFGDIALRGDAVYADPVQAALYAMTALGPPAAGDDPTPEARIPRVPADVAHRAMSAYALAWYGLDDRDPDVAAIATMKPFGFSLERFASTPEHRTARAEAGFAAYEIMRKSLGLIQRDDDLILKIIEPYLQELKDANDLP